MDNFLKPVFVQASSPPNRIKESSIEPVYIHKAVIKGPKKIFTKFIVLRVRRPFFLTAGTLKASMSPVVFLSLKIDIFIHLVSLLLISSYFKVNFNTAVSI